MVKAAEVHYPRIPREYWEHRIEMCIILLGLASGAQNFWYFAKEHLDRAKKEKPKRVGFNSHQ